MFTRRNPPEHRAATPTGRRTGGRKRGRSGVATVETAIVTPVLILLGIGCTDFGRVFHAQSVVANAARVGAEHGSTRGFTSHTRASWEAGIREAVERELENLPDRDAGAADIEVATTTDEGELFRVSVKVEYPFRSTIDWPGVPSQLRLKHRVELRRIR